jgi:AAA family ATP:ADP antiporter
MPSNEPTPAPRTRSLTATIAVDVRPGEGTLCWLLFAMHFLVLAFQYASKSVRQATYVDALGADQLPYVYLLIALVSYPVLRLYGRLVDAFEQRRLIAVSGLAVAASLVGFWWLYGLAGRWVSVAFYVWVSIVGILLVSQLWSYSSHLLDARQAKRLFGFIGAGGLVGSIAGGQAARLMSGLFETRDVLLPAAGVLVLLSFLVRFKCRGMAEEPKGGPAENPGDARGGLEVVRGSPYLLSIAAVMLLGSMVSQVIDLQFAWAVEENTTTLDQRTAVFGNLFSVMGGAAVVFQLLFTSRIHRRLGVGFALRVLPVTNGLGSAVFAAAAVMGLPGLLWVAAWILKVGENGLRYSLDQATRELLFQPVAAHLRPKAKAFIDVFVQRLGKGVAALALLPVTFHWLAPPQAVWLSLAWIVAWLAIVGTTHRRYVSSFRDALLRRQLEPDQELDLTDARTLEALIEGLGSSEPREVLTSLELLEAQHRGHLVTPWLLYHPEGAVRCQTLRILQAQGRRDVAPLVEKLLVDPDATVRACAALALVALTPQDIGELMLDRLRDPDVRMRAVAVSYLAGHPDGEVRRRAEETLDEMLTDGEAAVRLEAARALGALEDPSYQAGLVRLLYDREPRVIRGAAQAVRRRVETGVRNPLYVPILISHLHSRRLKHEARNALVAYGESVIPALKHFLNDDQEEIWVRRALPKTIAEIGGREAHAALLESLVAVDPFLRRKVIEALARLRAQDPRLVFDPELIEDQLGFESRAYLRSLVDLWSLDARTFVLRGPRVEWQAQSGRPHLLQRLLGDRMDDHLTNVFALLALLYPQRDIRAAHRGLVSEEATPRAQALEFLDNLLVGEVRKLVFAVIDDLPIGERLREARRLFDLVPADAAATLRRLATSPPPIGDVDGAWVTAAALHYVYDHGLTRLYPVIGRAAKSAREPLVQETTKLLLSRLEGPGEPAG